MTLIENWKKIALSAWSSRLAWLAAVLSGAEAALPFFNGLVQPGVFAILAVVVSVGAAVARLVSQPQMHIDG